MRTRSVSTTGAIGEPMIDAKQAAASLRLPKDFTGAERKARVEDVMKISGIKGKTFDAIKEYIVVR